MTDLHLHFERWQGLLARPPGKRAFHDFAVVAARLKAEEDRAILLTFGAERAVPIPGAEEAVERWYDEGGNTQTRIGRRGRRI